LSNGTFSACSGGIGFAPPLTIPASGAGTLALLMLLTSALGLAAFRARS